MQIDITTGQITPARQIPSPNCDARPDKSDISLIVIHAISLPPGEFGGPGVDQLFTNRLDPDEHPYYREIYELRVSSHLLIRRDGELVQYVPFHQRAWHAGESSYQGKLQCNDFAIGIELEGTDETLYEDAQYETLAEVIRLLCDSYSGLDSTRVAGHCDVSAERKTDPGPGFDWQRLKESLV